MRVREVREGGGLGREGVGGGGCLGGHIMRRGEKKFGANRPWRSARALINDSYVGPVLQTQNPSGDTVRVLHVPTPYLGLSVGRMTSAKRLYVLLVLLLSYVSCSCLPRSCPPPLFFSSIGQVVLR